MKIIQCLTFLAFSPLVAPLMAQPPEFPSGLNYAAGDEADTARSRVRDARRTLNASKLAAQQAERSLRAMIDCANRRDGACLATESAAAQESMARATAIDGPFA